MHTLDRTNINPCRVHTITSHPHDPLFSTFRRSFTIYHSQQTWADAILYRPRIGIKRTNKGPEYIARKIGRRVTRMYLHGRLPRDLGVEAPQTSKTSENLVRRKPSDNDGNIVFSVSHSTFSSPSVAAQLLIVALSPS